MEQENLFEEGEELLETVRKHFLVYLADVLIHSFACIIFIGAASFLSSRQEMMGSYIAYILIFFVITFWTSFFYAWTKNYLDLWYITDKHIIAIDQKDMLQREEAFMELKRIQDVSFEKNGFLQTFFGYGTLKVQSAGTEQEFIINNVKDVEQTAHRIMDLRDKAKEEVGV